MTCWDGGLLALCLAYVLPTIAYSTFQSFNGLNHVKNTGMKCLQAMLIRRENYVEENMYEQNSYQEFTGSEMEGEKTKTQTNPKYFLKTEGKSFFLLFVCHSFHLLMVLIYEEFRKGSTES